MKTATFGFIAFVFSGVMTASLSACQSKNTNEIREFKASDTLMKVAPPPPPGRLTKGKFLSEDSLWKFVGETEGNIKQHGKGKPFNALKYNKVIAYEFEGSEEPYGSIFYRKGKFAPVITKNTALNQKDVDEVTSLLSSKTAYGGGIAACFNPHLALVFYQDTDRAMIIDICLGCNYLLSSVKIPARDLNGEGFSDAGKAGLLRLCDKLGYVHGR